MQLHRLDTTEFREERINWEKVSALQSAYLRCDWADCDECVFGVNSCCQFGTVGRGERRMRVNKREQNY